MKKKEKVTSVRIDPEIYEEAKVIAQVDGMPLSNLIRKAIIERVEERRKDPEFQRRLQEVMEKNQDLYDRLADL